MTGPHTFLLAFGMALPRNNWTGDKDRPQQRNAASGGSYISEYSCFPLATLLMWTIGPEGIGLVFPTFTVLNEMLSIVLSVFL